MTEEIENQTDEAKIVHEAGYIDLNHFLEHRYCVAMGLIKFGGSFANALGETLLRSDRDNAMKILRYWNRECEEHGLLYKIFLAKERARESSPESSNE